MSELDEQCKFDIETIKRNNSISDIRAELQCMESCLAQGFTFKDYIDCQKQLIEILESL